MSKMGGSGSHGLIYCKVPCRSGEKGRQKSSATGQPFFWIRPQDFINFEIDASWTQIKIVLFSSQNFYFHIKFVSPHLIDEL